MAAAAGKKITGVYQSGVNVFMHIHTGFDARIQRIVSTYFFFIVSHETTCLQVAFTAVETGQLCFPPLLIEYGV